MQSIKAILAGSLFVIVVILVLQLLYVFLAVGYNSMAHNYPVLNELTPYLRYIVGIPVFVLILFGGGFISGGIAGSKPVLHGIIVAILTTAGMLLPTLEDAQLTFTGVVVIILAIAGSGLGGFYAKKNR